MPLPAGTSTACTSPLRRTVNVTGGPRRGCQTAVQPGMAATERTILTPCREDTAAAAGSAAEPAT